MTIKGVLFDFSGTLFRAESTESWLRAALREADLVLPEPELLRASGALEAVGALPGGSVRPVPPEGLEEAWHARDRSAEGHRAVRPPWAARCDSWTICPPTGGRTGCGRFWN